MRLRALLFSLWLIATTFTVAEPRQIDIAVISDGNSLWRDQVVQSLAEELGYLGGSDFVFRFPEKIQRNSEWNIQRAKSYISAALRNPDVDIIVVLGVLGSSVATDFSPQKPLIASSVINPTLQGYPISSTGSSGKKNLHYLTTNVNLSAVLQRFKEATGAKHVGILTDSLVFNAIPTLQKFVEKNATSMGFKTTLIQSSFTDPVAMVDGFPADLDALFLLPQTGINEAQHTDLINVLNSSRIPTFTTMGRDAVAEGFLIGTGVIPSPSVLGRQVAVDIRDIALGRSASELAVALDINSRLFINMATARAIGFEPPFSLLFEAEVLNDAGDDGRTLTLFSAVDESLRRNLSLAIARKDLQSSQQDSRIARSPLLPQLGASADWRSLDRDLAGIGPDRFSTLGISLSQSIYSETNRSVYTASRYLEKAQQASVDSTRLDVIQLTAQRYLNVLVTKTALDIQLDNLKLTQANLERAEFRYDVGSTNRSEVHRFETELGNDRQSVTSAQSAYQRALNSLNQVLHRPINDAFKTQEPGLSEPKIFGDERLASFLNNPLRVRVFTDFLAEKALENAPELVSLKHEIASQKRLLLAAKRKRYLPDVDLVSSVERIVSDEGAQFETDYDDDWQMGVEFSWRLYQGSKISAEKKQERIRLQQLELLYKQTADEIETNTRNSVVEAGSSRLNIDYAKSSAEAAEKTLNLVTDSYERGKASYIDLIDAQSVFLIARLSSANATYEHLLDLIALQRAIGFFDFYIATAEKEAWFAALDEYTLTYGKN